MTDETFQQTTGPAEERELQDRRLFLRCLGKWSGAAIAAAVLSGAWLASTPEAKAGAWVNRRGGYGAFGGFGLEGDHGHLVRAFCVTFSAGLQPAVHPPRLTWGVAPG